MDGELKAIAGYTALGVETLAVVFICFGAAEAIAITAGHILHSRSPAGWRRDVFTRFGVWLLLALQFALAADIARSVIAPTWTDIGQLAAIAVIRTFLNYFLERDLTELAARGRSAAGASGA